jgi:competence protein ComEA
MLRGFLNNYFGFNKQQRNGIYVLLLLCFFLLVLRIMLPHFIKPDEIIVKDLPLIETRLDSSARVENQETKNIPDNTIRPFNFDPNKVTREQLILMGFKERTAETFLKFRKRGFVFRKKQDLKKIYGVNEKMYRSLEPYIVLADQSKPQHPVEIADEFKRQPAQNAQKARVNLNSADSTDLISLPGIGPSYAKRILKYRNLLGGFTNTAQLKEVYGFTDELFTKVRPMVVAEAGPSRLININTDDFKTVNRHPYLSYELTKALFNARRKEKINPANLKQLLNDDSLYMKLLPYVSFD